MAKTNSPTANLCLAADKLRTKDASMTPVAAPAASSCSLVETHGGKIDGIAIRGQESTATPRRLAIMNLAIRGIEADIGEEHADTVLCPNRGSYFLALNPPENRVASIGFAVIMQTKVPWSFFHAALMQPELGQMADGEAFHRLCSPLFEQAESNRTQSL